MYNHPAHHLGKCDWSSPMPLVERVTGKGGESVNRDDRNRVMILGLNLSTRGVTHRVRVSTRGDSVRQLA